MSFHEIDDAFLGSIKHYLPPNKSHTGRPNAELKEKEERKTNKSRSGRIQ